MDVPQGADSPAPIRSGPRQYRAEAFDPTDATPRRRLATAMVCRRRLHIATLTGTAGPSDATHLMDLGHSSGRLHRWVRALLETPGLTLGDLLRSACDLAGQVDGEFEVMVPFRAVPDHQKLASHLAEWRDASGVSSLFAANKIPAPRQDGGFVDRIAARDDVAAARAAGALVQRLQARSSYARASRSRLDPVGQVWVAGFPHPLPVSPPARGVDVLSLVREKTMYAASTSDRLDDALQHRLQHGGGMRGSTGHRELP